MDTATSSANSSGPQLRAELVELLDNCPAELCDPEDCPLYQVRQLNHPLRTEWFKALTTEDLEYLAAYHHVCMKLKLQAQQAEMA